MAMQRFQILLDDDLVDVLTREARRQGVSRAELVRRAARERYGRSAARTLLDGPVGDAMRHFEATGWPEDDGSGGDVDDIVYGPLGELAG